jgi:hypothetical protein
MEVLFSKLLALSEKQDDNVDDLLKNFFKKTSKDVLSFLLNFSLVKLKDISKETDTEKLNELVKKLDKLIVLLKTQNSHDEVNCES